MIEIKDKSKCCGCTACVSVCPKKCIVMHPDEEGFLYPVVDKSSCVNCGLCETVCPFQHHGSRIPTRRAYIACHENEDIRAKCSSGGLVTKIAQIFLQQGGIVYGAVFDEDMSVCHTRIDNQRDLERCSGSKYVQSNLENTFNEIKQDLLEGKEVLFCGSPCQNEGLLNFLGNNKQNLYTIDFACHGVPSPLAWRSYLHWAGDQENGRVVNANFRCKKYGYHNPTMELTFQNGKRIYGSSHVDPMLKSFFSEICSRPSCYQCKIKTVDRVTDMTVFDCWHSKEVAGLSKDDNKGWTAVLTRTKWGMEMTHSVQQELNLHEVDAEQAVAYDGIMLQQSATPHPKRADYFTALKNDGIYSAVQQTIPITQKDHARELVKNILCKTQIMSILRNHRRTYG